MPLLWWPLADNWRCRGTKSWRRCLNFKQLRRAILVLELSVESIEASEMIAFWVNFILCSTLPLYFPQIYLLTALPNEPSICEVFHLRECFQGTQDSWYHKCPRNQTLKSKFGARSVTSQLAIRTLSLIVGGIWLVLACCHSTIVNTSTSSKLWWKISGRGCIVWCNISIV